MGWDVVGAVGGAVSWAHDKSEELADEAGHAIDSAVHTAEHTVDETRKGLVDFGERHGGVVGKAVAQNVSNSIGVVEGAGLAVYDAAAGVTTVARGASHLLSPVEWALHPERNLQRAEMAGTALTTMAKLGSPVQWALDPQSNTQAAKALWNGVTGGYQDAAKSGDWSKFAGRAVVDVGSFFIGAGEANAAIKGAEGANAAAKTAEALNAAAKTAEGVTDVARAAEGVNDVARAAEGVNGAARAAEATGDSARAADAAAASRVATAPQWFKDLQWSEPVKLEALRADRAVLPKEPGVYVFTNYGGPLEKNTGVLYVGKAGTLNTRLPAYLADPADILVLSQKSGGTRVSSTLRHAGKAQLLVEIQQRYRLGNTDSGIFVRWVEQSAPASLEDKLIKYLQPAFNTHGR